MRALKQFSEVVGLATVAAALTLGFTASAQASPVPPTASNDLLGTWVNTNSSSNSVKQIVVSPTKSGTVTVDAFGACVPTLCEWGTVPAIVYGPDVSATTGAAFQTNQQFLDGATEWSRTTLFGQLVKTTKGLRLQVQELTVFEDGSGRKNYRTDETFAIGDGQSPTSAGHSVSTYRSGDSPALAAGAFGGWVNTSATGALAGVKITGTSAAPLVRALGRCVPTACDWGQVRGITYGTSISSTAGRSVLAPYAFGFKNAQLSISYHRDRSGHRTLRVGIYNEFTDGSGRSNYVKYETFVHA